jgi:glyoxylate reductase
MRPRIFVTRKLPKPALARLGEVADFDVGSESGPLERSRLLAGVRDADGIISMLTDRVDREVISAGNKLRVISNVAVGFNNIDLAAAQERSIHVTNTPDVLTDATADLTWALILAVTRRIIEADAFTRAGQFKGWDPDLLTGAGLSGKTLGVVGYGRIGRAVIRRAGGFGIGVVYCGRDEIAFRDDPPRVTGFLNKRAMERGTSPLTASARQDGLAARRVGFKQLLEQSDIISLHVPLAATTQHLLDRSAFERIKPTAFLINTARGDVVDEQALVAALESGRLAGAALDVYESEPQIPRQLLTMKNVVLLPHIGSATVEARNAMALLAVENAIDALSGRTPRNLV